MTPRPDVAFVVQRYGPDVTGGSEALARAVAERLTPTHRITVFTTCARDYVTWRNELDEGREEHDGVVVRRFPVEEERDLDAFNAFSETLYRQPHSAEDELEWLRRQGPHVPRLVDALGEEADRFAAVVFFTYLYYPTYWGLRAAGDRAILVPTAHDEPPLRFGLYREVFALPRALAFLTPAEERLVRGRFDLGARPAQVAGMGVDVPVSPDVASLRARHRIDGPWILYAGRIDAGKGCAEMLDFYERYRRTAEDPPDLLLIGRLALSDVERPGVRYLGYLSEEEKAAAIAGARVVVCPSPYESFSIVLLEGMAHGVPGLVNGRSEVLKDHSLRSNAALFYDDGEEFGEALDLLVRRDALRDALGVNGRAYVRENYRWDAVLDSWRSLVQLVSSAGGGPRP
ncbi:MAG: glycosyltransferase family 4 protein [Acidobacteria bacterium]|nr:glycosyltransferase family 4 protein [Acidobacteriota bacterium]